MAKAYDKGANTIWVLNVGPLKGFENQTEYFLDLGRNIDEMRETNISGYVKDNAKHYFGFTDEQAQEYADIQCEFLEAVNARRPDFMTKGIYSITSYGDEGQKIADKYADLLTRSEALYNSLPEDLKPAFYELQLYAVRSADNVIRAFIGADKSALYKSQNRGGSVNKYAADSNAAWAQLTADMNEYNSMLDGKWNNLMNPFQKKESGSWDIMRNWNSGTNYASPETVDTLPYTDMGIAVENQQDVNAQSVLEFSGYSKDVRFIDIFNRGTGSFDWKATADVDWIIFNKTGGTVYDDDRIYAGIDWNKVPDGASSAKITITRYIGDNAVKSEQIEVKVNNDVTDLPEKTYAEANGYVSIEAEHYTASVTRGGNSVMGSGVVTGSSPRLITETSEGVGIIAIYNGGVLSSVQTSKNYVDGAYVFDKPVNPAADGIVKGMVWSSFEDMEPLTGVYGIAEETLTDAEYYWQEQDDLGRSGSSMKFMPDTAGSISDNSVYLEYDVNFETTGTFDIDVYRIPTLNERGSVNFAVGIDETMPTVLKGCNAYVNNSSGTDKWGKGVLNNIEILTSTINVTEKGIHKIRLYGIDPGAVIDKMVITTGTKYDSFYGAPESYNTTYNNQPMAMPEASDAADKITGDITALFDAKLFTAGINLDNGKVTGVDVIKLADVSNAQITVAAYDNNGTMLDSETTAADFSAVQLNEKVTVQAGSFAIPQNAAEIQVIVYDSNETLNALAQAYTTGTDGISLMASYNSGVIEIKSGLDQYAGKEAICTVSDDATDELVYIRQETVVDNTFKKINTGELDGTYDINIGVASEGIVITEKAYTAQNITPDNPEASSNLYIWDFADDITASSGNDVPVVSGNAVYDTDNKAVQMTSSNASGGKMKVDLSDSIKALQGTKTIIITNIAYGKLDKKYMDYTIIDSNGKELIKTHINVYNGLQSIQIGGVEQTDGNLQTGDGVKLSKTDNSALNNGYSTFTVTLDADTNTITINAKNKEGESTYTGKFPEGSSYDIASLNFSTDYANSGRSCYVGNMSISQVIAPSYTMSFDVQDTAGNKIDNAAVTVTDAKYGTEILSESDETYHLCDGVYSYTVTADGYKPVENELELSPVTESKTILVKMEQL